MFTEIPGYVIHSIARSLLIDKSQKVEPIDHRHRGLGSNSCGPQPEEPYELRCAEFAFTFTPAPDCENAAAFEMMRYC